MHINKTDNTNFKNLYIAKDLNGIQNSVAYNISKKLSGISKNGISYIKEIESRGYDVLIIKTELNDPDMVRLCIIKDMKSNKFADGTYDYIDAKPMGETGMHFSPQNFIETIDLKTYSPLQSIKTLISKLFSL